MRSPLVLLPPCLLLALAARVPAQIVGGDWDGSYRLDGEVGGDEFGYSVGRAGDVDGDGYDDIIVGAPYTHFLLPGGAVSWGAAYLYSGHTGSLIRRLDSDSRFSVPMFGQSVVGVGDIDGDGCDDVAVGAMYDSFDGFPGAGRVYLYSGGTGALIRMLGGTGTTDNLGSSLDSAGDVDGDGVPDIIAGAFRATRGNLQFAGSAFVYSGATGAEIWRVDGQTADGRLGQAVTGLGDVDGDGHSDFAVSAPRGVGPGGATLGRVDVFSGATGTSLYAVHGPASWSFFGWDIGRVGDLDGDGASELIVGAMRVSTFGLGESGSAFVYSGASGTLLRRLDGEAPNGRFGHEVDGAGDVDGDGTPDILIGASGTMYGRGAVHVYSGATWNQIHSDHGEAVNDLFGYSVAGGTDVDDDGLADPIVSARWADPQGRSNAGAVYVLRLAPYLYVDAATTSLSARPPIPLRLDFPPSEAGKGYAILLSAAGIGPTTLGPLPVPLTADVPFQRSLHHLALRGMLDASGDAQHLLRLHRQTPSGAAGRTLHLAAVSFDPVTGQPGRSSIARALLVLP